MDDAGSPGPTGFHTPLRAIGGQSAGGDAERSLGSAAADVARAWHRRLQPHVDHLGRVSDRLDTLSGERLRAVLQTALDWTDDDLLPLIIECEAVLYPAVERVSRDAVGARRMLGIDQRMLTELRHELRGYLAGDLDARARAAIRERLYGLRLLLRCQVIKHEELLAAAIAQLGANEADALQRDLTVARSAPTSCSDTPVRAVADISRVATSSR